MTSDSNGHTIPGDPIVHEDDGQTCRRSCLSPTANAYAPSAEELSAVIAQIVEASCRTREGDREAARAHIEHAIALLRGTPAVASNVVQASDVMTHVVPGGLPAWQIRKVLAHVEAHLSGKLVVGELARLIGLSASHFCRAFKRTLGISPRDYVLRRRIEFAQRLMLMTSEPLSAIAIQCGMCDQPHFTRSFHRIVGETPYIWRRIRQSSLSTE